VVGEWGICKGMGGYGGEGDMWMLVGNTGLGRTALNLPTLWCLSRYHWDRQPHFFPHRANPGRALMMVHRGTEQPLLSSNLEVPASQIISPNRSTQGTYTLAVMHDVLLSHMADEGAATKRTIRKFPYTSVDID
jgi:hypothetical protein